MRRMIFLLLACFFLTTSSTSALEWAYGFVVHNGKVYEVKEEETLSQEEIGDLIGKVETKADEYSGDYHGNASNFYEIGTLYYKIAEVSISEAIAVETKPNYYVKAVYVHDAPFHITNILFSVYTWILIMIVILFLGIIVYKSKQS
ncbi:ABC-type transport system substrate-binding protein [Bacillus mesophilus]|uniref:Uncharacterized protein n=1 Tax=Bacillus mesophilus TaxID=1808955 RepID=A0A6M0Q9U3_9BACI|nr:hypothetical protein [Bacillus mesophilus]MBM7662148.1 ABC-type transport system substrate-binding protein [Bacillus mesophilus]NEY72499.1 hypothetical protein [Bacillus mesophilus]